MRFNLLILLLEALLIGLSKGQFAEDRVYMGKSLGKLSTYHHQVQGEVYALDDVTIFIKGFTYDGNGPDAFFWAGSTNWPGNEGFLVPNEQNRTNVLKPYHNIDVAIVLPEGKKINEIRWLSVFDLSLSVTYGDILIPEGFDPPKPQELVELSREAHGVKSKPVVIVNTKTILIPNLFYDGQASGARFWVGTGTQVTPNGKIVPDEDGYLGPLRSYIGEDVTLRLPGNMTIFDIEWFSIYDTKLRENLGSMSIRGELNIPLARVKVIPNESRLPNCEQLHERLQVSWEVFGSKVTIQLAGDVEENDYMAFGISGSENSTTMIGADVVITYMDGLLGHVVDYNMTDKATCAGTSGSLRGVCPDTSVGGISDSSVETFSREDGINKITYVRFLQPADPADKIIDDKENLIVWALGPLAKGKKPQFHYFYSKDDLKINFARSQTQKNCFYFTRGHIQPVTSWTPVRIPADVVNFTAMLGPSGNRKGFQGMTGQNGSALVWYMNGYMAPDIYVKRGQRYNFIVYGGNDLNRPQFYHPMYITNDPKGGYEHMTPQERKRVRVYAGVDFDRRGRPIPTAVGKLCWWKNESLDLRRSDSFPTFSRFRNNLQLFCEEGEPATLSWYPNSSTPDIVYYQSFRQSNMGWRIIVGETIPLSKAPFHINNSILALCFTNFLLIIQFINSKL
ncbi:hypothetical protein CHUAL_000123 [Chamberlinius hualienensis]